MKLIVGAVLCSLLLASTGAGAQPPEEAPGRSAADHWTAERMAAAVPRDLVIDERGLAYLRRPDGSLQPYGHATPAQPAAARPEPQAKPGGGGGTSTTNVATPVDPVAGATVTSSTHTFRARVTATLGVRSVSFSIGRKGAARQSFTATSAGNDEYTATLSGLSDGSWEWQVVAKDNGKRGGTTFTSAVTGFTVALGGGTDTVANEPYTGGGLVQNAAGRIYFEMPDRGTWVGYVCSGTVVTDGTTGRSIILTAAHCVYDDAAKVFARNVIFIPNQDGTTGSGTDRNCSNDPLGCWTTSHGVVDAEWTTRTFPANIPWDYAYYVVNDTGAHTAGLAAMASSALDGAVAPMTIKFSAPVPGDRTHALGYSYSDDPNFMYCAEGLGTESSYGDWWMGKCDLSGGSSGGPWVQPLVNGDGPIISVNSWGYTNQPGMAGPRLHDTSASCVFTAAKTSVGDTAVTC